MLREASRDQHHRVAANALVGLHRIGAYDVTASLQKMAEGAEPMGRAAAAFAMGQILNVDFKPVLESLLKDDSPQVLSQALRSLIRLKRQPEPGEEDLAAGSAAATGDPALENTPSEPPMDATVPGPAAEAAPPEPANAAPPGTLAPSPEVPPVSADKEDKG